MPLLPIWGAFPGAQRLLWRRDPLVWGWKGRPGPRAGGGGGVRVQGRSSRGGAEEAGLLEEGGLDRAPALLTGSTGSGQSGRWHRKEEGHFLGCCGDAAQPKPAPSWGHSSCPEPPGLRPGGPWGQGTSLHSGRRRSSSSVTVAFRSGGAAQLQHSGPQHPLGKGEGLSVLQRQEDGEVTGTVAAACRPGPRPVRCPRAVKSLHLSWPLRVHPPQGLPRKLAAGPTPRPIFQQKALEIR